MAQGSCNYFSERGDYTVGHRESLKGGFVVC